MTTYVIASLGGIVILAIEIKYRYDKKKGRL